MTTLLVLVDRVIEELARHTDDVVAQAWVGHLRNDRRSLAIWAMANEDERVATGERTR